MREKIIANASDLMVVIADASKSVDVLGQFPLPVEVTPFGFTITAKKVFDALRQTGVARPGVRLREQASGGKPFLTDGKNYILDCKCGSIPNPLETAAALANIPGVVEHGLFLNMARTVILGDDEGAEILEFES